MTPEEKDLQLKRIEVAMAELDRQFGSGSVQFMGKEAAPCEAISTGALTLDMALGIGGLPLGRLIEIYGVEASGKSTLAMSIIAEAQKYGLMCAYIDAEHTLDVVYANDIGINVDEMIISQPDHGEMAFDVAETLIRTGQIGVVVIDSVAALVPEDELKGNMEKQFMGLHPRMMNKGLRKLSGLAHKNNTMVIFINQLRQKIGIMFGNPETTPGGMGLKYATSVRLDMRRLKKIEDKDGNTIAIKVKTTVVKNKMASPYKVAEFDIVFGKGINTLGCIVDVALERGILTGKGWIKYNDETFAQGRDNAVTKLAEDLDLAEEIKQKILAS